VPTLVFSMLSLEPSEYLFSEEWINICYELNDKHIDNYYKHIDIHYIDRRGAGQYLEGSRKNNKIHQKQFLNKIVKQKTYDF